MAETIVYSDIDFKWRRLSASGDLNKVTNENAINQSLLSLFNTTRGERVFNPGYGSNLKRLLFEPLDTFTGQSVLDELKQTVSVWEPRIKLTELNVEVDYDNSAYNIYLQYQIVNTTTIGTLSFTLEKI